MIYILQFDKPLGNPKNPYGQARYYVGYCDDDRLDDRLAEHRRGHAAKITAACNRKGICFNLLAILPGGSREDERRIKRMKNTPRLVRQLLEKKNIQPNLWMFPTEITH